MKSDGTGVADKAETIVGIELDQAAFVDLMRAGGGYGNRERIRGHHLSTFQEAWSFLEG